MSAFWQRIRNWWGYMPTEIVSGPVSEAQTLLSELAEKKKVPGIAVCVLKNAEVILQQGWGYARLEEKVPMDPVTTLTRAASASKPIAAMALGKLVASGQMDWDASYHAYVPYFPEKSHEFSLRQLASHTAGIRAYKGKEYALNKPYSIRDSLAVFQDDPLIFKPGTSYAYTSYDWVMLSLAAEEVTGVPFAQFVGQEVLGPLGLHKTRPEIPGETDKELARFYTKNRSGFRIAVPVDNRYKLAGGGYLTTAKELARFGQACMDYKILDKSVMDGIWKAQRVGQKSTYYGLGWEVSEDAHGRPYYGHRGNSVGAYTNFYLYPEQNVVFVALINCTDPGVQPVLDKVRNLVLLENPNA